MQNKVSIITASYNYENYIQEAIESVINQTYENWELIIVDDGSVDNSVEVIKKYCAKDKRIKLFQHQNGVNKGLKETMLLGIEKAQGEWVSFLESDDIYAPNYLEEKVQKIAQNSNIGLVFNDVELIGDKNEIEGFDNYLKTRGEILNKKEIPYEDLLIVNLVVAFSCAMVKKSLILNCDFNSPLPQSLDYYLWTQIYPKADIAYIPKKLTKWRKHGESYMNRVTFKNQPQLDLALLKNILEINKNGVLLNLYYFTRQTRVEKLFRPFIKKIDTLIIKQLLKNRQNKTVKLF